MRYGAQCCDKGDLIQRDGSSHGVLHMEDPTVREGTFLRRHLPKHLLELGDYLSNHLGLSGDLQVVHMDGHDEN